MNHNKMIRCSKKHKNGRNGNKARLTGVILKCSVI